MRIRTLWGDRRVALGAALATAGLALTACNLEDGRLTRLATAPLGAELTGIFLSKQGDLFFNAQHPDSANIATDHNGLTYNKGTVGVIEGWDFRPGGDGTRFSSLSLPSGDEKQLMRVAVGQYRILAQQEDRLDGGDEVMGEMQDPSGNSLVKSNDPDFNAFIDTDNDGNGFLFTNWEDRPGGNSRLHIEKNGGQWQVVSDGESYMVDFRDDADGDGIGTDKGTWVNCFGTMSPWETPLSAEENYFSEPYYEGVATRVSASYHAQGAPAGTPRHSWHWNNPSHKYFGGQDNLGKFLYGKSYDHTVSFPNPYHYGYVVEILNPEAIGSDEPDPRKHYAMGRRAVENAVVMPDEKTVYLTDDGTGTVLYKFVATATMDRSDDDRFADNDGDGIADEFDDVKGTLYAARVTQKPAGLSNPRHVGFDIEWVELGTAYNAQVKGWADRFNGVTVADQADGRSSYITDAEVADYADGGRFAGIDVDGNGSADITDPDAVAFLESRMAAARKGATNEWRKMEGINAHMGRAEEAVEGTDRVEGERVKRAYMYMAMSNLNKTMLANGNGYDDPEDQVRVDDRVDECGAVYRMQLLPARRGGAGHDYDVRFMEVAVSGGDYDPTKSRNACDVDRIAEPDNLVVLPDGKVVIGEDTGEHENNMLWLFDPKG